jgi:hypothetical protein
VRIHHVDSSNWERQNPDRTEGEWPDAVECRRELEETRLATLSAAAGLGKLIDELNVEAYLSD